MLSFYIQLVSHSFHTAPSLHVRPLSLLYFVRKMTDGRAVLCSAATAAAAAAAAGGSVFTLSI